MPIKAVLLDLSGVVYQGDKAIAGSLRAIERLKSNALPIRFLTNTTRSSKEQITRQLNDLGLATTPEEIFTPVQAALSWLQQNAKSPYLLVHQAIQDEFSNINRNNDLAVIIGDAGEGFDYQAMNNAFRKVIEGAPILALAANRTFRDKDGCLSLDAGAFVKAIEFASGSEAHILGKPSKDFYALAISSMNVAPKETVMVGDDADADVSGALAAGLGAALLVRTGKYREEDETRYPHPPTKTVADLEEAVHWILQNHTHN